MARILVIDDSSLIRKILSGILKAEGHEVLKAVNGREGLQMAVTHRPDCILLDLLMPEMDGFELLNKFKEQGMTIPVIVSTADIQDTTRKTCLELGAVSLINKPPKKDGLLKAIQNALDLKGNIAQ